MCWVHTVAVFLPTDILWPCNGLCQLPGMLKKAARGPSHLSPVPPIPPDECCLNSSVWVGFSVTALTNASQVKWEKVGRGLLVPGLRQRRVLYSLDNVERRIMWEGAIKAVSAFALLSCRRFPGHGVGWDAAVWTHWCLDQPIQVLMRPPQFQSLLKLSINLLLLEKLTGASQVLGSKAGWKIGMDSEMKTFCSWELQSFPSDREKQHYSFPKVAGMCVEIAGSISVSSCCVTLCSIFIPGRNSNSVEIFSSRPLH